MTLAIVILLLLLGLLLLAEILVIPGFGIAGVGGILLTGAGLYMSYTRMGTVVGVIVTITAVLIFAIMLYLMSKSKIIDKFKLKSEICSSVEEQDNSQLKIGDEGQTITRLNLYGKVKINGVTYQARSLKYIDTHQKISVLAIESNIILVKPI